ncbi:MAG: oxygen-independent coproporphyrinogen III oxidase [Gemmatimonadaceae bacterium]|nr:oxygen-independent coproporphyrinogen III oxidase [Gemmatimonadaceae bacterium]
MRVDPFEDGLDPVGGRFVVPQVDPALLDRYDVSVPRYTSYPAVPDWNGAFTRDAWRQHLGTLNGSTDSLALYVHLPFCASRCLYCGCNATVTRRAEVVDRYLDRLQVEIDLLSESIGVAPRVAEMHWGGGTPNFLDERQTERLFTMLRGAFPIDARTECSVEADPRLVSRAQLDQYHALGFSRISFGVQDLDAVVQHAIGRIQPEALVRDVVAMARAAGFGGINLDLIYGLPEQTAASFAHTVKECLSLAPDRVACFGYAHVPWMRAQQKRIDERALPRGVTRFALFRDAVEQFVGAGYEWLGIDHFALPNDPLSLAAEAGRLHRNFMGYTTRVGENLLGIGTSAISEVNGWYVQNTPELGGWQRDIDLGQLSIARGHVRSVDDSNRADAITHLMCNAELPFDMFVGDMFELVDRFEAYATDGLVEFESDRVRVTPLGRFFLRNLCATLDAYRVNTSSTFRFSRAV